MPQLYRLYFFTRGGGVDLNSNSSHWKNHVMLLVTNLFNIFYFLKVKDMKCHFSKIGVERYHLVKPQKRFL